ncbi:hypothetical protein EON81_14005 [bacterium]|nr:MAG: hypothetical protein EON81_14005 [bacterium]
MTPFLLPFITGFGQTEHPHLVPPRPEILAKEEAAWQLFEDSREDTLPLEKRIALLDRCEAALGGPKPVTLIYRFFYYAMAKRFDEAFKASEFARRHGDISGGFLYDEQYKEIRKDPRWAAEVALFERLQAKNSETLNASTTGLWNAYAANRLRKLTFNGTGPEIYKALSGYSDYQKPRATGRWFVDTLGFASTTPNAGTVQIEYFVRIPKGYRPDRPTPVLMWLHGAWFYNGAPRTSSGDANHFDNPLLEESDRRGYIEIMPLPYRSVAMTAPGNSRLAPEILAQVKRVLNVDDDRVYIAGHSNGGSGGFAAAAECPTAFASFYPVNGWPLPDLHYVNMANRPIEGLTGEKEDLFLPAGVRELQGIAASAGADWTINWVPGGKHDYSSFMRPYAAPIFDHMAKVKRTALSAEKVWECDPGGPNRVDWLQVLAVDPARPRADWHTPVTARHSKRGDAGEILTDAFVQNEKSGCVRATYRDNVFDLKTSRVGKVRLWIHPEMVDMAKPVIVMANGREVFRAPVTYDQVGMMNGFIDSFDRRLVWANKVDVEIP